jgi:hypothetical protein
LAAWFHSCDLEDLIARTSDTTLVSCERVVAKKDDELDQIETVHATQTEWLVFRHLLLLDVRSALRLEELNEI